MRRNPNHFLDLPRVHIDIEVSLESNGVRVLCESLCKILAAVEQTGSIKSAAETTGRSYRFVWARIKEAEKLLETPLVKTRVGGVSPKRSRLTSEGTDFVRRFTAIHRQFARILEQESQAVGASIVKKRK